MLAKEIAGNDLVAERAALSVSVSGGEEIREVPFVYFPNLMNAIGDIVDRHQRYVLDANLGKQTNK